MPYICSTMTIGITTFLMGSNTTRSRGRMLNIGDIVVVNGVEFQLCITDGGDYALVQLS